MQNNFTILASSTQLKSIPSGIQPTRSSVTLCIKLNIFFIKNNVNANNNNILCILIDISTQNICTDECTEKVIFKFINILLLHTLIDN